jgi:meiotic recombination protein SPO11
VLVVEKEALFARLLDDRTFFARVPCVLVTGCGMPDLATRALVHAAATALRLPVLVLVDSNPWGLQILLAYARGSAADGRRWAVPAAAWLGLCKEDIARYGLGRGGVAQAATAADIRKARAMLTDAWVADDDSPLAAALRCELAAFAEDGAEKMELEGLYARGIDFVSATYLPDKLARRDWVGGEAAAGTGGAAAAAGGGGGGGGDDDA